MGYDGPVRRSTWRGHQIHDGGRASQRSWRLLHWVRWSGRSNRSSTAARSPACPTGSSSSGSPPARCGRRGGVRRPGSAARADGAGRLPSAPGRPAPRRGRLPGRLPGPGSQGALDPRSRPAGQLALRRRPPHVPVCQAPARPRSEERGGRRHERTPARALRPRRPSSRSWPASRPRSFTRRSTRLPRAFRLPVVLCYFEGLTLDEAARRLRCPPGTVRSRLARARDKLRRGLTRRGVVLPAAAARRGSGPRARPRRRSHPPCATSRPGPRSNSRPDRPPPPLASATALAQEVLRSMLSTS